MFKSKTNTFLFYLISSIIFYICINGLDLFNTIVAQWYPNITNYLIYDISKINPQKAFDEPFNKFYLIFFDISFSILLFYFIFIYFFNYFFKDQFEIFHLRIIWTIKCVISLFVVLLYELNFGLDQNTYFYLSVNNVNTYSDNFGLGSMSIFPNLSSNSNMVNLLRGINFFTLNSWFSIKIFFAFLFLMTVINFYKLINIYHGGKKIITLYLLSILPSFILFTSIVTKDAIILCLTSFIFLVASTFKKKYFVNLLLIITFLVLIFIIRKWMSLFILFAFIATVSMIYFYKVNLTYRLLIFSTLIILLLIGFEYLNSILLTTETKDLFAVFYRYIMAANYLDGYISYSSALSENLEDTTCLSCSGSRSLANKSNLFEIIVLYPKMMFLSIFSPFIFDLRKMTYLIPILENLMVLALFIVSFFNLKKEYFYVYLYLINLILIFSISYAVINYLNMGNSFRYSLFMRYIIYAFAIGININLIESIIIYVYKKTKSLWRPSI